jgi:NADH-quinone oxidoreductase subunit L
VAQVAFWMVLIAALFTAFYSWRLMFLTFHGRPRASREVMSQAHESPNVMLVPLYGLAAGSLFAGILFYDWFIGAGEAEFWGQSIYRGPDNHILEALHHVPGWVVWSPAIIMAIGFAIAWLFYIRRPDLPHALARRMSRSTGSCSTSGTSTSSTISCSCGPPCGWGASCGSRATAG